MPKLKINNKDWSVPNVSRLARYSPHETLIYMGEPTEHTKQVICVGIGLVKVIQKGEEYDMVAMDFGRGFTREIYVNLNHARRQIYTLKRGQYAWFYGTARFFRENGKLKAMFFAKALQGWFVPKQMDIVKADPNDIEEMTKENESKIDFIDNLFKED